METSLCADLRSNSLLMDVARTRMAADSKHDYLHVNSVELVIAARFGFRALRLNTKQLSRCAIFQYALKSLNSKSEP